MTIRCERESINRAALCGCLAVLLFASGCSQQTPVDTQASVERTIRDLDAQWSKAAAAHDLERALSYYSDDAYVLPPNEPMATNKQAVRAGWAAMLVPGTDVSWETTKVEVASSSDMAYQVGTYTLTIKDAAGKVMTDHGKLLAVWKKQPDGKWKAVADTWNSDLPLAVPEPMAMPAKKKTKR